MTSRRGFLGYLASLTFAGMIGPKLLAAPSPEIWKAAPRLPALPMENGFVTLSQFLGRTIELVHEETKWLRLERALGDQRYARMGNSIMMREPVRYKPEIDIDWSIGPGFIQERIVPVTIESRAGVGLTRDGLDWGLPFDQFSRRHIEPLAYNLADQIAASVKRHGGAGLIVCAQQRPYTTEKRSVALSNESFGLALLGTESVSHDGASVLHVDMIYGLA